MGRVVIVVVAVLGVLGALVFFAMKHDDGLIAECRQRSLESLREEAKVWIVTRLVKSRHPHSDAAIPDGTPTSKVEYWGPMSEDLRDMAFYTELEGGIAYDFRFDRYCGFEVAPQRCPNRQCQIGRIVTRS